MVGEGLVGWGACRNVWYHLVQRVIAGVSALCPIQIHPTNPEEEIKVALLFI